MSTTEDRNTRTIDEFRRNHGKVGGNFDGAPLLLLQTVGARSGQARVNPMMYLADGGRYLVFASKAGADTNPDWYHKLKAHPDADETLDYPGFAGYQRGTSRIIPVIVLTTTTR